MAYGTVNAYLMTTSDGVSSSGLYGFKNRLINSAMVIDQRNAGAAVTTSGSYIVDRYFVLNATDGAFSSQRSTTVPSNFVNSLYFTTTTADSSLGSTQAAYIAQHIEGFNTADFGWGTSAATSVTLSFKVRSSLTGTFGGSVANSARNRSYPFTYSISSANTWTDVSITIPGDTTGTWVTDNGIGIRLLFGLGVGSGLSGTAGAWAGADYRSATSAIAVISTLNATFYITGVQLEKGSTATSFDYRPYGQELALCQRYFEKSYNIDVVPGTVTETGVSYTVVGNSSGNSSSSVFFNARKRAGPTITTYSSVSGTSGKVRNSTSGADENSSVYPASPGESSFSALGSTSTSTTCFRFHWTSSSEL